MRQSTTLQRLLGNGAHLSEVLSSEPNTTVLQILDLVGFDRDLSQLIQRTV